MNTAYAVLSASLRDQLRHRIARRGLTQLRIAETLCVSRRCVSRFLNGKQNLTLLTIVRLATAIGCRS